MPRVHAGVAVGGASLDLLHLHHEARAEPATIRAVSNEPAVYIVDNFATAAESTALIELGRPGLMPSMVGRSQTSPLRTSSTAELLHCEWTQACPSAHLLKSLRDACLKLLPEIVPVNVLWLQCGWTTPLFVQCSR